ncbi:tetratricopeptide repeat protein [Aquipuribacter sp. MA13-6]|uniref:tetratricopeptide repeat protein n=1 Tax=unclassified Aquipuribacter TaxID=2635084 RepID=UPI003EF027C1
MSSSPDYGPVPVSRLKDDVQDWFQALEDGRRVLVSRHGQVVAAIDPPSMPRHTHQLASFALREPSVKELSATDIGQRSPSEAVHRAERGESILVTRGNKVFGVLGAPVVEETLESVDAQEEGLAAFEAENPDATPEQFAAASTQVATVEPWSTTALSYRVDLPQRDRVAVAEVMVDAFRVKGLAYEARRDMPAAEEAFLSAIEYRSYPDVRVRSKVARTMVDLAKIYTFEGRTPEALDLSNDAVEILEPYLGAQHVVADLPVSSYLTEVPTAEVPAPERDAAEVIAAERDAGL